MINHDEVFTFNGIADSGITVSFKGVFKPLDNEKKELSILLQMNENKTFIDVIVPKKKMTLEEIEKELGYKIELVDKKDEPVFNLVIAEKVFAMIEKLFNVDSRLISIQEYFSSDLDLSYMNKRRLLKELESELELKKLVEHTNDLHQVKDLILLIQNKLHSNDNA